MTTDSEDNPIPTEPSPTETAVPTSEEYLRLIQAKWQKRTSSVFDVALPCHDANKRLSAKAKKELLRSALPFGKATFLKLAKIGGDQRLVPIAAKLPASFSTIYEVALLSDEQFEDAVNADLIHPKVRRAEIVALRKASKGSGDKYNKKAASKLPATEIEPGGRYELKIPEKAEVDACARITQALGKLRKKFNIEVHPTAKAGIAPAGAPVAATPSGSLGSPVNQISRKLNASTSLSSGREKRPEPSVRNVN